MAQDAVAPGLRPPLRSQSLLLLLFGGCSHFSEVVQNGAALLDIRLSFLLAPLLMRVCQGTNEIVVERCDLEEFCLGDDAVAGDEGIQPSEGIEEYCSEERSLLSSTQGPRSAPDVVLVEHFVDEEKWVDVRAAVMIAVADVKQVLGILPEILYALAPLGLRRTATKWTWVTTIRFLLLLLLRKVVEEGQ